MSWWRVKLHSEGWLLEVDGEVRPYGFFTTRCVSADGMEAAAEAARVDARWELEPMVRHEGDLPFIRVQQMDELPEGETRVGFVFYASDEEDQDPTGEPEFRVVRSPMRSRMKRLWSLFRNGGR